MHPSHSRKLPYNHSHGSLMVTAATQPIDDEFSTHQVPEKKKILSLGEHNIDE